MSRINTNISALQSINRLTSNQLDLSLRLERLSSGLRINRGRDDPAGLIASESLRSEIRGLEKSIENSSRAINVISTAEAALAEVSALLLDIRGLINASANVGARSDSEIQADQLQIDSLIESIDRIANTTQFNGKKLIDGQLAYTTSGVNTTDITRLQLFGARLPEGAALPVTLQVTQSAQTATLAIPASAAHGLSANGTLLPTNTVTIEVRGLDGTQTFTFNGGTVNSAIRDAVNNFKQTTGVSASLSGNALRFNSVDFGSEAFVSVRALNGTFTALAGDAGDTEDKGRDVGLRINGQTASGKGLQASLRASGLDLSVDLGTTFATTLNASTTFGIKGGGATFAIGPDVNSDGLVSVGIPSIASSALGSATDGFLKSLTSGGAATLVGGEFRKAERIVRAAIEQVSILSGRLGGFQRNQIETNINSRRIALENVQASESAIRDVDYAQEVSQLTRAQILVQANTLTLGIANQTPQNVLSLLRG
ncbi:MAG: flagellin [Phycisphaerae bacterium]|nr:flagellin [Phycisphaerae bacterium]